jgi:hypothetical protein
VPPESTFIDETDISNIALLAVKALNGIAPPLDKEAVPTVPGITIIAPTPKFDPVKFVVPVVQVIDE